MGSSGKAKAPPKDKSYPASPLPDNAIGGAVEGIGITGGRARLLDAESGAPVGQGPAAIVGLIRHTDGRHYYRFDRVPDGSYRVAIELEDGRHLTSGLAMPGVETGDVFAD
jgi:hypothetical protein